MLGVDRENVCVCVCVNVGIYVVGGSFIPIPLHL